MDGIDAVDGLPDCRLISQELTEKLIRRSFGQLRYVALRPRVASH